MAGKKKTKRDKAARKDARKSIQITLSPDLRAEIVRGSEQATLVIVRAAVAREGREFAIRISPEFQAAVNKSAKQWAREIMAGYQARNARRWSL